jgi:hypothetical protein
MSRLDWLCYSDSSAARFSRAAGIMSITVLPAIVVGIIAPEALAI